MLTGHKMVAVLFWRSNLWFPVPLLLSDSSILTAHRRCSPLTSELRSAKSVFIRPRFKNTTFAFTALWSHDGAEEGPRGANINKTMSNGSIPKKSQRSWSATPQPPSPLGSGQNEPLGVCRCCWGGWGGITGCACSGLHPLGNVQRRYVIFTSVSETESRTCDSVSAQRINSSSLGLESKPLVPRRFEVTLQVNSLISGHHKGFHVFSSIQVHRRAQQSLGLLSQNIRSSCAGCDRHLVARWQKRRKLRRWLESSSKASSNRETNKSNWRLIKLSEAKHHNLFSLFSKATFYISIDFSCYTEPLWNKTAANLFSNTGPVSQHSEIHTWYHILIDTSRFNSSYSQIKCIVNVLVYTDGDARWRIWAVTFYQMDK